MIIDGSLRGQADQTRQSPRNRYDSGVGERGAPAAAQQQGHAQRLVDDARKRMRRVDRHGREQRIQFAIAVVVDEGQGSLIQFVETEDANSLLREFRPQTLIPVGILFRDELVGGFLDQFPLLHHGEPVGGGGVVAVFDLLQQAADPDFKEFIQVAGGNGQKLHAFEQRIAKISRFFKHAPIEFQPRCFAVKEGNATAQSLSNHVFPTVFIQPRFLSPVCRAKLRQTLLRRRNVYHCSGITRCGIRPQ